MSGAKILIDIGHSDFQPMIPFVILEKLTLPPSRASFQSLEILCQKSFLIIRQTGKSGIFHALVNKLDTLSY